MLRGAVTDTAGTPVPFALVRIHGATSEQFTTARGGFAAAGIPAGTYRIQVRQVGFQPFDSAVTVGAGGASVRVVLRPNRDGHPRSSATRFLERQRLVRVHFLRPLPSDSTPRP